MHALDLRHCVYETGVCRKGNGTIPKELKEKSCCMRWNYVNGLLADIRLLTKGHYMIPKNFMEDHIACVGITEKIHWLISAKSIV